MQRCDNFPSDALSLYCRGNEKLCPVHLSDGRVSRMATNASAHRLYESKSCIICLNSSDGVEGPESNWCQQTIRKAMEHSGPGRRPSSPSGTPSGAKGQGAQSGQRPKVKITQFHGSPIVNSDRVFHSKRPGAVTLGSPHSLLLDSSRRLLALSVREKINTAAAGGSEEPTSCVASSVGEAKTLSKPAPSPPVCKVISYIQHLLFLSQLIKGKKT